jgi:NDP-sugar pyrophosphorylase family protein
MGRPLVGYVAEYLARFGCDEIVVNLHHRPESVRAALGDGRDFGVRFIYIKEEPDILGTSGAIGNAREYLKDDTFIVVNGKIATDIDLSAALETHRRERALATLVLRPNVERERYSIVEVENGLVKEFGKFPAPAPAAEGEAAPLMFTGIQILEPRIFDFIPPDVASDSVPDVYTPAIERGERIAAHVASGMWHELSTIQRYLNISLSLLKQEGHDVQLGAHSIIEAREDVHDAILWENARIEAGARVRRAVIGAGVQIRRGEVIEDAAVVRAALIGSEKRPDKALAGEVRGENFVVPLAQ